MELVQFYSTTCRAACLGARRRGLPFGVSGIAPSRIPLRLLGVSLLLLRCNARIPGCIRRPDDGYSRRKGLLAARSVASIVSGSGIFVSLWLLACDFVGSARRSLSRRRRSSRRQASRRFCSTRPSLKTGSSSTPCARDCSYGRSGFWACAISRRSMPPNASACGATRRSISCFGFWAWAFSSKTSTSS